MTGETKCPRTLTSNACQEALDAVITGRLGISDDLVFREWCADSVGVEAPLGPANVNGPLRVTLRSQDRVFLQVGLHRIAGNVALRAAVPQICGYSGDRQVREIRQICCVTRPEGREQ